MAYTNSPLVAYTKLSPNHSGQRTQSIDRITPHCVVGQCTAEGLGDWFAQSSTQASSNYGIDKDGRVGLYVEERNRSWCSSSNANDQRAITIECASDTTEPYAFRDVVYQTLIKLCVDICQRYGKKKLLWLEDKNKTLSYSPAADEMVLTVHRWFANKSCPGNWMYARMGDLAQKVTAALGGSGKEEKQSSGETEAQLRARIVNRAISYLGCKESDGSHKKIIDLYNSQSPLPVDYKVTYTDAWCDAFASAVAVAEKLTDIIPTECGCERHITLFKKIGRWVEDDAYIPSPGDYIFYDWQDSGSGDNTGGADHVGIVVSTSGGTIKVIEGNKSDAVGYRDIAVNGKYIRGFGVPDYAGKAGAAPEPVPVPAADGEQSIWDFLLDKIGNPYGVAGLMGNLCAESGLKANNLQNTGNNALGMTDDQFTAAMDSGSYDNFVHDGYGYGLAQWTWHSRKAALLAYAQNAGTSIGDLGMQLGFLWKELSEGYASVLSALKNATSVRQASDVVLTQFERPADQGEAVQKQRAAFGQTYYDKYAGTAPAEKLTTGYYRVRSAWDDPKSQKGAYRILANAKKCADANPGFTVFDNNGNAIYPKVDPSPQPETPDEPFLVKVSISDLNIRTGPGTNNARVSFIPVGVYTIVATSPGQGSSAGWGKLKSGAGWISLDYVTRL